MLATARLERFAVVSFAADPDALAAMLPAGVEVDVPLVSAVAYRYVGLGLRRFPLPRLSGDQVHLRAYVRVGDERGVWFLRTVQDSPLATLPHRVWAMPWARGAVSIDEPRAGHVRVGTEGIELDVAPSDEAVTPPDEVATATVGWFLGRGRVRRFHVGFADDAMIPARAERARVAYFEDLGLVAPRQPALGAFRHADTEIRIHLPPRRVHGARPAPRGGLSPSPG